MDPQTTTSCDLTEAQASPWSEPRSEPLLCPNKTKPPTGFFDLPAELRNVIYEDVLNGHTFRPNRPLAPREPYAMALTRVNKQIYAETEILAFSLSTFKFFKPGDLHKFVDERTGRQLEAVRKIRLCTYSSAKHRGSDSYAAFCGTDTLASLAKFANLISVYLYTERVWDLRWEEGKRDPLMRLRKCIHEQQPAVRFTANISDELFLDPTGQWRGCYRLKISHGAGWY